MILVVSGNVVSKVSEELIRCRVCLEAADVIELFCLDLVIRQSKTLLMTC